MSQADWGLDGLLDACRTWPMRLDALAKPPSNDWKLQLVPRQIAPLKALKISQQRLDSAAQVLLMSLPANQRAAVGAIIPAAAARIADRMQTAAARGVELSDTDIDALVGAELRTGLSDTKTSLSLEQAFLSKRALEAAAASASLSVLKNISAQRERSNDVSKLPFERAIIPNLGRLTLQLAPRKPSDEVTAIELPYRLIQTPLATAGWAHAVDPVTHSKRTELWHTRLGRRDAESVVDFAPEPLRAIWSPDYPVAKSAIGNPPRWALYGDERRDIVRLTAGFDEKKSNGAAFVPQPTTAKKLMLSALGATLDLDGAWRTRPAALAKHNLLSVDIESWTHKTALARDYFVRVVKAGFLFPFGHRASLVRITERKFETRGDGGRVAILRQRAFVIVREPVRDFTGAGQAYEGRDFPFRRIEILTKITPDLDSPGGNSCDKVFASNPSDAGFVPVLPGGEDFLFRMIGVDGAGRRIPFSAPLVLILESRNTKPHISQVVEFYSSGKPPCAAAKKTRARVPMNGAVIQ